MTVNSYRKNKTMKRNDENKMPLILSKMDRTKDFSKHFIFRDSIEEGYYSSHHDRYILADNIELDNITKIKKTEPFYNNSYHIIIVVTSGVLNLHVNNYSLSIESGHFLAIMPGTSITIEESECRYFMHQVSSYIMHSILDENDTSIDISIHFFTFHHVIFSEQDVSALYRNYLKMKYVMNLKDYQLKEFACKGYITMYLTLMCHIMQYKQEISYSTNFHKELLFKKFLTLLGEHYKTERTVNYYANRLAITTKYLSSITMMYAHINASRVIDGFVVMQIIVHLYKNAVSIKEISDEFNFPTQSFFGRYFKRVTGLGPREFIKQCSIKVIK